MVRGQSTSEQRPEKGTRNLECVGLACVRGLGVTAQSLGSSIPHYMLAPPASFTCISMAGAKDVTTLPCTEKSPPFNVLATMLLVFTPATSVIGRPIL
ncbi:hypothetical protein E2C01_000101 [Portunus trituberculatus]|uniref:Uncharacterized protein n=1 Tax=Portunus trituberculatus TaxID=210409 RepID=A0A5B7CDE8_PORTR|nr:hypothetical protein [Portunus trituberculatus]